MSKPTNKSAAGWSIERRRAEIRKIVSHMTAQGLESAQAKKIIADRFMVSTNLIDGWVSDGPKASRMPPDHKTLDLLRYELFLIPVRPLIPASVAPFRAPPAAHRVVVEAVSPGRSETRVSRRRG